MDADLSDLALLDVIWRALREVDVPIQALEDAYAELRSRLSADHWPEQTFAAALEVFGPAIHNTASRSYKALDKRIAHCRRTWRDKFGPLNSEQEAYADSILAYAIRSAKNDAGSMTRLLWPYAQTAIGTLVNHEEVHAGFKRRGAQLVDVTAQLAELTV